MCSAEDSVPRMWPIPWQRGQAMCMVSASAGRSRDHDRVTRTHALGKRFQRFLLEYDDERSGDFEPLKAVPRGVKVVLGLVTTKFPRLEGADDLVRRIDEASKYVPLDDLAISPQCGFASTVEGNIITPDDQWRKLDQIIEVSRRVWGDQ